MPTKPVRVTIYLRVSKDDVSQETGNQLIQLRDFCGRWDGHELVAEYVDRESGTKGRRERKDFDRMFADAARRRFDVVFFWALDRFSREGIRKTIAYLDDDASASIFSATRYRSRPGATRGPRWLRDFVIGAGNGARTPDGGLHPVVGGRAR